jgi:hypothetical protein
MPDFNFTREEVARLAAPNDPWQRQLEFTNALDFNKMREDALIYREAAAQSAEAHQLAQKADQISESGGAQDRRPVVDARDRIDRTAMGLQTPQMEQTVNLLVQSMNWAIDEEEKVRGYIPPLEQAVQLHRDTAEADWNGLIAARNAVVAQLSPSAANSPNPPRPEISHGQWSATLQPRDYVVPESLGQEIRQYHLEQASQVARRYDADIAEEIEVYRRRLDEHGDELTRLGYDVAGPLGLWTSPEVGAIDARMLREELAKPEHLQDAGRIDVLTQTLEGINAMGEEVPGQDARRLDPNELEYLKAFYTGMDKDTWLALGDESNTATRNVANGLNLLTNPEIGGIDPAAPLAPNAPDPLQGVRPFIYDYQDTNIFRSQPGYQDFRTDMEQFNAFGGVMERATIAPGDQMTRDQTRAAIDVQHELNRQLASADPDDSFLPTYVPPALDTGSSGLLHNAALNEAESAAILNDPTWRNDLLGEQWDVSSGVGDVVNSGTTVPQELLDRNAELARPFVETGQPIPAHIQAEIDSNNAQARPYVEAGYNVLDYASAHPELINGQGKPHADLETAVGDTTLRYMDMIGDSGAGPEAFGMTDGVERGLFGKEFPNSFNLSDTQRQSLFTVMAKAEPDVANRFIANVHAWEVERATEAFQRAESGTGELVASDFAGIGLVGGTLDYAVDEAGIAGSPQAQAAAAAGTNAAGGAIKDLANANPAAKALTVVASYGLSEQVRNLMGDPLAEAQAAAFHNRHYGSWAMDEAIATAATASDFRGSGEHFDSPLRTGNPDEGQRWTQNVGREYYDEFVNAKDEGYRRGQEKAEAPPQPR